MTIASSSNDDLWCANAFYKFLPEQDALLFTSNEQTRHIKIATTSSLNSPDKYSIIAGSIVLETEEIGKIRGLQFRGELTKINRDKLKYRLSYLQRFPYAVLKNETLWLLILKELKYTDNRLGFGKKEIVFL